MSLLDSIGIDLGTAPEAPDRLPAARDLGARLVRVRFTLGQRAALDESFLAEARQVADSARALGLRLLAVLDGDLTVAPNGAGAFDETAPGELADAWAEELCDNAARLAQAIAGDVAIWEILPAPNTGSPPRIAPARWATFVARATARLREADPRSSIVAGSLVSDEFDDGVEYLHEAYARSRSDGAWPDGTPPFDAIAIRLDVLPDGGASEDEVAAALSERTRRLWRVVENLEGTEVAERRGILVTGVSWDANRCAEDLQGRNAWTALDTLTADPVVRAVVWSYLVDGADHARGLHRGPSPLEDSRRPAWRAFHDFSRYAAQIGPPRLHLADMEAEPIEPDPRPLPSEPPADPAPPLLSPGPLPEPPDSPETTAPPGLSEPDRPPAPSTPEPATGLGSEPPEPVAQVPAPTAGVTAREGGRTVAFRIPDAAEVLRSLGLAGAELEAALAAVVARYGGYQWLPPGEYEVELPGEAAPARPAVAYTNQQVISALYRAGGGTWAVLDRSGLLLSDLANRRDQPYSGPPIEQLERLTEEDVANVLQALEALARET